METIRLYGETKRNSLGFEITDEQGNPIQEILAEFEAQVQPLTGGDIVEDDYDGEINRLQLFVDQDEDLDGVVEGATLTIRGEEWIVTQTPWDYGKARNPWNKRHKPRIRVLVERRAT